MSGLRLFYDSKRQSLDIAPALLLGCCDHHGDDLRLTLLIGRPKFSRCRNQTATKMTIPTWPDGCARQSMPSPTASRINRSGCFLAKLEPQRDAPAVTPYPAPTAARGAELRLYQAESGRCRR